MAEVSEAFNRQDNSTRSPPKRVETDPAVWQGERTVRPIQDAPIPFPPTNQSNQGTPTQRFRPPEEQPSPYNNSNFAHSDSQLDSSEHDQRGEWRNSGWGRQPGGLGVGNNL